MSDEIWDAACREPSTAKVDGLTFDGKYIYQGEVPLLRIHPGGATPEFCAALVELWNRQQAKAVSP